MSDLKFSIEDVASALARTAVDMGLLPEEAWEEARSVGGYLEVPDAQAFADDVSERVERGGF